MVKKGKVPWNLSVPKEIKKAMLVYCAQHDLEISELTEDLWRELLARRPTARATEEPNSCHATKPARHAKAVRKKDK